MPDPQRGLRPLAKVLPPEGMVPTGTVEAARGGSTVALDVVLAEARRRAVRLLAGTVPDHDIEHVAQEVAKRVLSGISGLKRVESFTFWLRQITLNERRRYYSRLRRQVVPLDDDAADELIVHHDALLARAIERAIGRLPEKEREAIALWRIGSSETEIADELRMSRAGAHYLITRALARLRQLLGAMR